MERRAVVCTWVSDQIRARRVLVEETLNLAQGRGGSRLLGRLAFVLTRIFLDALGNVMYAMTIQAGRWVVMFSYRRGGHDGHRYRDRRRLVFLMKVQRGDLDM